MKKFLLFLVLLLPNFVLAQIDDSRNLGQDSDPIRNYSSDDPLTGKHHDRVIRYGDYRRNDPQDLTGLWPEGGIETGPDDYDFKPKSNRNGGADVQSRKVNNLEYKVDYSQSKNREEHDSYDERIGDLESLHEDEPETDSEPASESNGNEEPPKEGKTNADSSPEPSAGLLLLYVFIGALGGGIVIFLILTKPWKPFSPGNGNPDEPAAEEQPDNEEQEPPQQG